METSKSPELGRLLVNTSSLLTWLGKYDDALALESQAARACEEKRDVTCQASAAHVQGFTRYQLGDYESAAAASRRAVRLFGESQPVERARALNNLGLSQVALKQPREALATLKLSMALLDQAGGDAKDKATTIDSTATAYRSLHDYKTANLLYQDALLRWRIAGHREGERDTLANLGQLAADMQQPEASIFYYKLSVNLAQSLRANAKQLEPGFLDSITRRLAPSYQTLAGELVDQGRLAEAQQVMRMLKEQELFDFLRRDGPTGDTTAALNGLEQSSRNAYESLRLGLFKLARELDDLSAKPSTLLTEADKARMVELQALLKRANDDLEKFLVALNQELAKANRSTDTVVDGKLVRLQSTLDALGRGAVVLHYVPLPDHLSIILTASQSQAVRGYRVEVNQKDLNEAIFRFRDQISHIDPAAKATARELYDWLMPPPLRADLADADAKILMVSLADSLRYVPFSALYDGNQWLAERYAVAMFNDAVTDALKNAPQAQWSVRAFGMTQAAEGFPALSWVRNELNAIVGPQGLPGSADFDADFTFDRLRDAVTQRHPPVLHIASHFMFRPGTEDDSFLLLGVGRLTLTDIKRMKFSNLDLLTLSACETAMSGGVNLNGREVEGFAALAQERGADSVLATLWSVADISTAAFMQSFYRTRRTHDNLSKVEALQLVQLAMIRGAITASSARAAVARGEVEGGVPANAPTDYSHPFYWAPFVLSGNWR
jgi:CHAT domain-containing protein